MKQYFKQTEKKKAKILLVIKLQQKTFIKQHTHIHCTL